MERIAQVGAAVCKENRIEGAMDINRVWLILITAEKPIDRRKKKS